MVVETTRGRPIGGLGAKIVAARAVAGLARRAGRGGGTSLPGLVLKRLEPHAIGELAARLSRGSAVISATNGKTTTAAMSASVLARAGVSLVHNRTGANMAGGVASTLLAAARAGRQIDGELGLFEVDEFWLDAMVRELQPRAILLCICFAISSTATASWRRSPNGGRPSLARCRRPRGSC
jgi:lipid II isoglutaminyl synthase (glutamine-hydrolysing)